MSQFLEEVEFEEISKANQKPPETEDPAMQQIYEDEATNAAIARLKKIKVWHEIGDNFTNEDKLQI